jgi:hypothetical protein
MEVTMSHRQLVDFLSRLPDEQFLLHGSVYLLEQLEPRQASGYSSERGQNHCAVYATNVLDIAIVKATVQAKSGDWGWNYDCGSWWRRPVLNVEIYGTATVGSGYIYILDRRRFSEVAPFTMVSYTPVVPEARVEIPVSIYKLFKHIRFWKVDLD